MYRSMPDDAAASWPRKGNLWGSGNFAPPMRTLEYAASHVDLWLGAHWSAEQAATLRTLNPSTLVLTSINACEGPDGLPEELYLHNITRPNSTRGRLESWPGAFRLDVTKPATQRYQAMLMYNLMLYGGVGEAGQPPSMANITMPNDGMFVDNVFLTQSWAKSDIHNNPFFPDTTGRGKPDDPKEFDAKWRAGIIGELRMFRALMPNAVMSGHAMSPTDPDIQEIFNAISIGFTTVDMIEGKKSFQTGWQEYLDWMTLPKPQPHITMVESAVRLQLGYGYGFDTQLAPKNQDKPGFISKETYQFSAHEYRYMRFGLAYTLMRDGYFAHELGDSWHGQDWWYDELEWNMGTPTADAKFVGEVPTSAATIHFPATNFSMWVDHAAGAQATMTVDKTTKHSLASGGAVKVDISSVGSNPDCVDLRPAPTISLRKGVVYNLTFWAKAAATGARLQVNARMDHAPWSGYGLDSSVDLSTQWQSQSITFNLPSSFESVSDAWLSFFLGQASAVTVWIDSVSLGVAAAPVTMRTFTCGAAILNGSPQPAVVSIPYGYSRLVGSQAPKHQYIVDDGSASFNAGAGWSETTCHGEANKQPPVNGTCLVHGYDFDHPSEEENEGPYYHTWEETAHIGSSGTSTFELRLPEAGQYTLSAWWPAVSPAPSGIYVWSKEVRFAVRTCVGGEILGSATFSQADSPKNGDRWNQIVANLTLPRTAVVSVECNPGSSNALAGLCIADAVLVESMSRLNDGSDVGTQVTVAAFDGAILANSSCRHH